MEGKKKQPKEPKQDSTPIVPLLPPEDRWKFVEIKEGDMKKPLLEESSFATLFPKYREKYIKEVWTLVKKALHDAGVKAELDLIEGSLTVRTTAKTWDPYIIIKARDVIKLLARSVPYEAALRVLQEETYCDIIKIRGMTSTKEKFVKRRQRLLGPRGNTLKALELLTNCYIMVQGSTVSVIGHYKQLKMVRRIVEDCMKNIHPVYHIKELMIKKELAKDEKLKTEDWSRFLPNFKKTITNTKEKKKLAREQSRGTEGARSESEGAAAFSQEKRPKKKERALFPPAPQPRKIDLQIESGEFFMSEKEKRLKKDKVKQSETEKRMEEQIKDKRQQYEAPSMKEEVKHEKAKQEKMRKEDEVTLEDMKKKFGIKSGDFKL